MTLTGSTVSGNRTTGEFTAGGGIYANSENVTLTGSTVSGNSTEGNQSYGDGIVARGLTVADAKEWRLTDVVLENFSLSLKADNSISGGGESISAILDSPWQNFLQPGDVNNDGIVQASDASRIINELARREYSDADTEQLNIPSLVEPWPHLYYDQNGDGKATSLDALRVINELGRQQSDNEAGEEIRPLAALLALPSTGSPAAVDDRTRADSLAAESVDLTKPRSATVRAQEQCADPRGKRDEPVRTDSKESRQQAVDQLSADDGFLDRLMFAHL